MPIDLFDNVNGWTGIIIGVGGAAVVVAGLMKWVRPKWRAAKNRWGNFETAIIGREAIVHPETGRELAPAVPGIGARQANIESQIGVLTDAVAKIADSHQRIDELDRRIAAIESGHMAERIASKVENIQLFSAIEAIAKDEDPIEPQKPDGG